MAVSNLTYDLVTVLQNKMEALSAYEHYLRDAQQSGDSQCQELFSQIQRDDEQHVKALEACISQLAQAGKFQ